MKLTASIGLLITLLVLLACAGASSTKVGRNMYSIDCKRERANCYEEASNVCPGGFDVMDSADHSSAIVSAAGNTAVVTPIYKGEMLVRCKSSRQAENE